MVAGNKVLLHTPHSPLVTDNNLKLLPKTLRGTVYEACQEASGWSVFVGGRAIHWSTCSSGSSPQHSGEGTFNLEAAARTPQGGSNDSRHQTTGNHSEKSAKHQGPFCARIMSTSPTPSLTTNGSTKRRKKRKIVVVRRPQDAIDKDVNVGMGDLPRKKTIFVSRRPRTSEGGLFENNDENCRHQTGAERGDGFSVDGETLKWHPDGRVLEMSILGTAAAFEEMEMKLGWARNRLASSEYSQLRAKSVRSLHSQKSEQNMQSAESGFCPSTRDWNASGQARAKDRSRPGTSLDDQTRLQKDMVDYFRRIVNAEETAIKNRAISARKEAKLMEHVGMTEKLTMQREGKALRQWEWRQRDWHRVTEGIVAKTGKIPEDLVMSTIDEYRERNEEYQLIQSAIPCQDKHSSEGFWMMSLRGYGERVCNMGNIFTGLHSVIEDHTRPPRAVRKPTGRLANASRKRTWRNSKAFVVRKQQLAPALRRLRPKEFKPQETSGLLVRGQDLLEWAATSSREYFQLRRMQEMEAKLAGLNDLNKGKSTEEETGCLSPLSEHPGPAMEVISPRVLLIESTAGGNLQRATVLLRNTGSTVLFFSLSRLPREETIVSNNGNIGCSVRANTGRVGGEGIRHESGQVVTESARARHAALQNPGPRFFCYKTSGTLLPGQTSTISFSFKSTDPGLFSDRWRLETVPLASFSLSSPPPATAEASSVPPWLGDDGSEDQAPSAVSSSGRGGGFRQETGEHGVVLNASTKNNKGINRKSNQDDTRGEHVREKVALGQLLGSSLENRVVLELRGVALSPDTREHVRKKLSKGLERGVMAAKVEEIVREVVRGVRTPIREEEIRRRQREDFLKANAERGLYFTPHLYDGFMSLLQRAKAIALSAETGSYDAFTESDDTGARPQPANQLSSSGTQLSMGVGAARTARNEDASDDEKGAIQESRDAISVEAGVKGSDDGNTRVEVVEEGTTKDWNEHGAVEVVHTEATSSESEAMEVGRIVRLMSMLQALNSSEWDGSVDTVLDEIEGLSKWILSPAYQPARRISCRGWSETEVGDNSGLLAPHANEGGKGGESHRRSGDDVVVESDNEDGEDEEKGEDEEQEEEQEEEEVEGDEEDEEENEEDGYESHLHSEQKSLRAEWRKLVLDAQLEPELDCSALMREEVGNMMDEVAGAMEEARQQASGMVSGVESLRRPILGYSEDLRTAWEAACPAYTLSDIKANAQERAAAAAKAGSPIGSFLALAYGKVAIKVADAMDKFDGKLAKDEADHRKKAATNRLATVVGIHDVTSVEDGEDKAPVRLSRLAALAREDVVDKRVLFHVDLSSANEGKGGSVAENACSWRAGEDGSREGRQFSSSETVQLVADQVQEMLAAEAAAIAIVSELGPSVTVISTGGMKSRRVSLPPGAQPLELPPPTGGEVSAPSLRTIATALSSLLGMEIEFYESIREMAATLGECNNTGGAGDCSSMSPLRTRLMMAERLSAPGVVPLPPAEEPEMSDGEEERLPDFTWGGEEAEAAAEKAEETEAAQLEAEGPGEGDLGAILDGVVDVVVLDPARAMYEPRRAIPWGPRPTTGLTAAGTGLYSDLTAMAYLTESPGRPLLAIVGGGSLEPRLKLIDGLVDLVDILAIGGGLAATFLSAAYAGSNANSAGDGDRRKMRHRWRSGPAGKPRDAPDVMKAARTLLTKARKRGVKVILPRDMVVGDIKVDEHGILPRPALANEREGQNGKHPGNINANSRGVLAEASDDGDGGIDGTGDGAAGVDPSFGDEGDVSPSGLEPDDESLGFEYEGETMDVSLMKGIPKGFIPMDIGPETITAFKNEVTCAGAILWHGMLGVAECSAFQSGTREILEAVTTAHDNYYTGEAETAPIAVLCGRSLGEWASRLVEAEDGATPLGAGSGVSHVCVDPEFCTRVLEGRIISGVTQLTERDPPKEEADLGKLLRRQFEDEDAEGDGESEEESSKDG